MSFELFAACLPGLEPFVAGELEGLDVPCNPVAGGVAFKGDANLVARANLQLGTATQVLLRCGTFRCRSLGELARKSAQLPWGRWLNGTTPIEVRATAKKSRLYHTGAIAERVFEGITMALGDVPQAAPETEHTVPILARFRDDTCTLSIDTSGEPLHRRGWRLASGKAPLRPDLAHALILASGWNRQSPLLDPFCGSGTIVIEAARLAARLPPGGLRKFAWQLMALADEIEDVDSEIYPSSDPVAVSGTDRDAGAVSAATANAERAGVQNATFTEAALADSHWERIAAPGAALVTNPPFGRRVRGGPNLGNLYQSLGRHLAHLPLCRGALLAADPRAMRRVGRPLWSAFVSQHGGSRVSGLRFEPDATDD